jgi:hypothetical protein
MARIILEQRGQVIKDFPLHKGNLTIGRKGDNTIVLGDPQVSGYHARIDRKESDFILIDLQSTNGTLVNNRRIFSHRLAHGDRITIGKHALLFIGTEKAKIDAESEKVRLDKTVIIGGTPRAKAHTPLAARVQEFPIRQPQGPGLLRRLVLLFLIVAAIVGIGLWTFRSKAPALREMLWKDPGDSKRESRPPIAIQRVPPRDESPSLDVDSAPEAPGGDSRFALEAIVWSSDGIDSFALINGLRLVAGDSIEGMRVKEIGRDYVLLESEDGESSLRLTISLR